MFKISNFDVALSNLKKEEYIKEFFNKTFNYMIDKIENFDYHVQKIDGESIGQIEEGKYELFGYIDGNDFIKLNSNVSQRDENGIPISFVWIRIDKSQILELKN